MEEEARSEEIVYLGKNIGKREEQRQRGTMSREQTTKMLIAH
jgi:hypothetical protein